jgi:MBOAT, membrane-bound O-acyltransferase family
MLTGWIQYKQADFDHLPLKVRWLVFLAIGLRILLDFSGYSDMAIGFARMMGIRLPENFNWPYLAGSIIDFWRRWHISLSTWIRDYVYIPLGGSRHGFVRKRFCRNGVVWALARSGMEFYALGLVSWRWLGCSWRRANSEGPDCRATSRYFVPHERSHERLHSIVARCVVGCDPHVCAIRMAVVLLSRR